MSYLNQPQSQRYQIATLRKGGFSSRQIAKTTQCHYSTVAREINHILRSRLKANDSSVSSHPALTILRQIEQHRVVIDRTTYSGTSRLVPERKDLFHALCLPELPAKTPG